MCVYHGENYLAAAIQSILDQTLENYEFLIIDDGSSDNTNGIIRSFACCDRRTRLIAHRRNRGLIACLNEAMQMARARYIARHVQPVDLSCHGAVTPG
jgi:glycosyltransferase involved in cell wall biosynthesis